MSRKVLGGIVVLFALVSAPVSGQNQHVLVNIWDGTEWSVIKGLYDRGRLLHLSRLGQMFHLTCNQEQFGARVMATATKPQHATMLTGCLADVAGVYDNKNDGRYRNYQLIADGITVYELIEAKDLGIRTAHISGKPDNVGESTFGNIIPDVDYFNSHLVDPVEATYTAIDLIRQWRDCSFFIVCHFRQPDEIGHDYGVGSKEYLRAIEKNYSLFRRLLHALRVNGIGAQTTVYVLSDHGFGCPDAMAHRCSPNTFIVSNDWRLAGNIYMKDVAGFLLFNFGLWPSCY